VPDTLTEKIASGIGAVPAGLLGLLPAIGVTAATTPFVGPIAGAAAGFGLQGAVREQDQGIDKVIEGGLMGGTEGAAFGALGKLIGPLTGLKGKELTRQALKSAAGGGVLGGSATAARQKIGGQEVNPDDIIASGAVMGLLGLTPLAKGKLAEGIEGPGGLPRGTTFKPTGETAMQQLSRLRSENPDAMRLGENVIKRNQLRKARPDDPFFLKYVDPENYLYAKQKLEGGMTTDQVVQELRADNKAFPAVMLERNNQKFAESFLDGKARDITKFTIEEANQVSRKAAELELQAMKAKDSGASNAAELSRLADEAAEAAVFAYASGTSMASELGRGLASLNAQRRGFSIGDEAMYGLAREKRLTKDTMVKIRELEAAGKFDEIRKIAGAVYNPKLADKVQELWTMGLLSSPMTWGPTGVNVVSNFSYSGLRSAFKLVGSQIDKRYLGKKSGISETAPSDLKTNANGLAQGALPALKNFIDAVKNERTYESGKIELTHGPAIEGKLGKAVRFPGRALTAADEFFRTLAHSMEVAHMAREKLGKAPTTKQITELSSEIWNNPLKHVKEINRIRAAGNEGVFTTSLNKRAQEGGFEGFLGQLGGTIQEFKSKPGAPRLAAAVAPFVRTPTNIAIEALKMSPVGLMFSAKSIKKFEIAANRYKRAVAAGENQKKLAAMKESLTKQQRELSYDLAKGAVGSTIFGLTLWQAQDGNITGGGPTKYEDYQKWIEAGNQPYSVRAGKNSPWFSYQRIEPFSSILGAAADIHEIGEADEDKTGRAIAAIKNNLANKTFLMGVENFAQAWADPERYGDSWFRNLASTALPASSAMGWAARAIDPVARIQTVEGEDLPSSIAANVRSGLAARIPFARETLDPRYSTTGREIKDEYSLANAILPFKMAPSKAPSIVESELDRLARSGYTVPSAEKRRRKVPGLGQTALVTSEEYKVFADTNKKAAETLERIMSVPSWENLEDDTKARIISQIYRRYRRGSSAAVRRSMANRLNP
jgi:hypothetical protein